VVAVTISFASVLVDLWVFLQGEISIFSPDFGGLIASLFIAPIAIVYLFAGLEWTRFNQ
jgi:hypothetical protein